MSSIFLSEELIRRGTCSSWLASEDCFQNYSTSAHYMSLSKTATLERDDTSMTFASFKISATTISVIYWSVFIVINFSLLPLKFGASRWLPKSKSELTRPKDLLPSYIFCALLRKSFSFEKSEEPYFFSPKTCLVIVNNCLRPVSECFESSKECPSLMLLTLSCMFAEIYWIWFSSWDICWELSEDFSAISDID